jgi:hypothetical protein
MTILGLSVFLWLLIVVDLIGLVWCTENENPFIAAAIVGVSALVAHFAFGVSILALLVANPLMTLAFLGGYLVAGVMWAFPKWWFYVRNKRNAYLERVRSFLKGVGYEGWNDATTVPDEHLARWFGLYGRQRLRIVPLARDHKSRILHWMAWWPFSMLWTLINDPIRHIYRWAWESLRGIFDSISRSAMGGLEAPVYVAPDDANVEPIEETEDLVSFAILT